MNFSTLFLNSIFEFYNSFLNPGIKSAWTSTTLLTIESVYHAVTDTTPSNVINHYSRKKKLLKLKIFNSRGDDENDKFEKKMIEHVADTNTCSGTTAGNVNACVHM